MKDVGEVWHDHNDVMSEPRTYEVTTDTVLNTRELIAAGLKMRFDDWEKDLDKIEHMLNEGKKIYVIQHNYAGCGMLSDGVYSDYDVDMKSFIANDSSITLLS